MIDTDIDQRTTQLGLVKKIELGIRKELGKDEPARKFLSDVWEFLKNFEVSGIKFSAESNNSLDETVFEEFSYTISEIANRICNKNINQDLFNAQYDGILILIDEADNASREMDLGTFFKLLMERLQRRSCNSVMIGLAGLTNLRNVLMTSHPSSIRLFEEVNIDRLSHDEVNNVIDLCLEKANKENTKKTSISEDARAFLNNFSEGYPHFIQQFGYCAFAVDKDDVIDDDCIDGAFGPGGAMELIGDRYYRDNFYNKIQKESYRQVLRIMANIRDVWVSKKQIRSEFKGKDSTLDNAISALRNRHIILSKEGEKGIYRLQHRGFAHWIRFFTIDPEKFKKSIEKSNNT